MRGRSFAPARVVCGFVIACAAPISSLRAEDVENTGNVDQIIVTASRLQTTQSDVGSSVSVVTKESTPTSFKRFVRSLVSISCRAEAQEEMLQRSFAEQIVHKHWCS